MCYQDGKVVYGETGSIGQARGDGTDSLGYDEFLLGGGGSIWKDKGGAASCKASLFYFGKRAGVADVQRDRLHLVRRGGLTVGRTDGGVTPPGDRPKGPADAGPSICFCGEAADGLVSGSTTA